MRMSDPRFTEMLTFDPYASSKDKDRPTEGARFDGMTAIESSQREGTGGFRESDY